MNSNRMRLVSVMVVVFLALGKAGAESLEPLGAGAVPPAREIVAQKAAPYQQELPILGPDQTAAWTTASGETGQLFVLESIAGRNVLKLAVPKFAPGKTLLVDTLPGDLNGEAWDKHGVDYLSFECKSTKQPAQMILRLTTKGKALGNSVAFSASTGEWRRVIVPIEAFGLKDLAKMDGLGFAVNAVSGETEVLISKLAIGNTPYTNDSWETHRFGVSLKGNWRFATDAANGGLKDQWFSEGFNDDAWKVLETGKPWQAQGIDYSGYGWYRQKFFVPKECAGQAVTFTLANFTGDDDVWLNGVRIGGIPNEYRYANLALRTYTAPASLVHAGGLNTLAIRIWGGAIGFDGAKSGLVAGTYLAAFDPYALTLREPGGEEQPAGLFDFTPAQQAKPFEMIVRFPGEILKSAPATLRYRLSDFYGGAIGSGSVPVSVDKEGVGRGEIQIDGPTAQTIYLRGRFKLDVAVCDGADSPVYVGSEDVDHLCFAKRDVLALPELAETVDETPYGRLKLVDEIDCTLPLTEEPHPYLQGGFNNKADKATPGSQVDVVVHEILGRKARESGNGWFAYRIGRGKLKPRQNYLVRIEYPEDKPRYCPVLIEAGHNYMGIGWKNGLTSNDPYDNWPLSHQWQWYDAILTLDDETLGSGGAGSASAEHGFWVYLLNKVQPDGHFALYEGGPAVARMKLYEIDPEKNAPDIHYPEGQPHRVLMVDWERQPNHNPNDIVRYCKLMGYNAVSPIIIKWGFGNYSDPLNGYDTTNVDDHGYWVRAMDKADGQVGEAVPGKPSIHTRYLEATKRYGIDYVPRVEYGGSYALPEEARAIGATGKLAKPNRFAEWSGDLLNPAVEAELDVLLDHLYKPYAKDNPQLTGMLWRIRSDRMPISYSRADLELFAKETGTALPGGSDQQWRNWASTGKGKEAYENWWHGKRAALHQKLADRLKSYREDMTLYYYNWDADKWSLIQPDLTSWAFLSQVSAAPAGTARDVYLQEREERSKLTADDYVKVLRSGDFGKVSKGVNRADYGIRPELYGKSANVEIFAPANYRFFADSPGYLDYFKTGRGLAVSNLLSYDEVGYKSVNAKFECNMVSPAGGPFSMAMELLAYFHGDARTLTYTPYTFGRGFADAHRRFAQAFLALPATEGKVLEGTEQDLKVRLYPAEKLTYVGVAYKGYEGKKLTLKFPGLGKPQVAVKNLVTNLEIPSKVEGSDLVVELTSGPMELNALLIQ